MLGDFNDYLAKKRDKNILITELIENLQFQWLFLCTYFNYYYPLINKWTYSRSQCTPVRVHNHSNLIYWDGFILFFTYFFSRHREERKLLTSIFIDLLPRQRFFIQRLARVCYPSTSLNNDKYCEINNEFIVSNVRSAAASYSNAQ